MTLWDETEWVETVYVGVNFLVAVSTDEIVEGYEHTLTVLGQLFRQYSGKYKRLLRNPFSGNI